MNRKACFCCLIAILATDCATLDAAELVTLTPETWDEYVPQGKEVDCIYGDFVMRNDQLIAVIAQPLPSRHANMTVRDVGGMVIDLTRRDRQNDQLSAFYPEAARFAFTSMDQLTFSGSVREENGSVIRASGSTISLHLASQPNRDGVTAHLKYSLSDGQPVLLVETLYTNGGKTRASVELGDALRADRTFTFGTDRRTNLYWAHDDWFREAYGLVVEGFECRQGKGRGVVLQYVKGDKASIALESGEDLAFTRRIFAGDDLLQVRAIANQIAGVEGTAFSLHVKDPAGDVENAKVTVTRDGAAYASGRTPASGRLSFALPIGTYEATIEALGRSSKTITLTTGRPSHHEVELESCGYVAAHISDEHGGPIPCKVAFHGIDGTASPFYAPDSGEVAVHNLYYSHDGRFRQEIGPGKYDVVISYGPEFDAVFTQMNVERGKETQLRAQLRRVVDTTGWVSGDFHSHSSPSGDNTSSQLGRVLNLLCEHLEFNPCTEHNRVDSYMPHLKALGVEHLMATCTGIELTGNPLPVNHQNAFPLVHTPRTQDGGAPLTDINPIVQIERLALWDAAAEKVVQGNHPTIHQILGDKDTDGRPDGGFESMFGFMDVIEVHPPQDILNEPKSAEELRDSRNRIFQWLQLLNIGYRIPGVVNTDAHYNFHGSGWLRNYIKSPTDDPARVKTLDMVHAAERGNIVMTNGPFLEVKLKARNRINLETGQAAGAPAWEGGPGDDVAAPDGKAELHVRVQCANWLDVNRVQVFLNGRPTKEFNFTRRTTPDRFTNGVVKFDATVPLELNQDTHVIVVAAGEGLQLGRVMGPDHGTVMPIAVANPIFVDVDGGGFICNSDDLGIPVPTMKTK